MGLFSRKPAASAAVNVRLLTVDEGTLVQHLDTGALGRVVKARGARDATRVDDLVLTLAPDGPDGVAVYIDGVRVGAIAAGRRAEFRAGVDAALAANETPGAPGHLTRSGKDWRAYVDRHDADPARARARKDAAADARRRADEAAAQQWWLTVGNDAGDLPDGVTVDELRRQVATAAARRGTLRIRWEPDEPAAEYVVTPELVITLERDDADVEQLNPLPA